ncbi:MAG: hypothetical protein RMK18_09265 [Armatimonadota bacterium]|nr:hypothetical protein [Armatimonadota bacterium]MDW8026032.1 hypothetical protein [Armatimonadota bacterium]
MRFIWIILPSFVAPMLALSLQPKQGFLDGKIILENKMARILIDESLRVVSIIDKKSGKENCADAKPFVTINVDGKVLLPSSWAFSEKDGELSVEFLGAKLRAKIGKKDRYFSIKISDFSGNADEIKFATLCLKPSKYVSHIVGMAADDEFGVCIRALNLQTNVTVGGRPATISATCFKKYGFIGAGVALVAAPMQQIRDVLKEVVKNEGLIHSRLGGPFALDAEENKLSYVFASVSEQNVSDWITVAKMSGINIIHFIGWESSYGHYEPRKDFFPNGMLGLKKVVEKIHKAGLKAGLHTLTGCISPHDPYVTPIPDKRLAKRKTFTLSREISEKDDVIYVEEKPEDMDTIWAYASRGNVLQIDEELVQYSGYSQEPPYRFFGCKRGAFGTKPSSHPAGSKVHYLYAYYGTFYPDENSSLVDEIAQRIADIVNECGFDLIYQDGAEGMPGGWHGVSKMRAEIAKRFRKPVRVEASEWGYHSWTFHSCIGAWDHPCWGLKRFVDIHCQDLEKYERFHLLPGQLGWWVILGPTEDYDAETPDEMEYLCCKALGYNVPVSLQGVTVGSRPWNARQDEYLVMLGRYERLRLANYFSEDVRAKLREFGKEFRLIQAEDGSWELMPTEYIVKKVTNLGEATKLAINNPFDEQHAKFRIQALYSAAPYDAPESIILADFSENSGFKVTGTAKGVTCEFKPMKEESKFGGICGYISVKNLGAPKNGSWARITRTFLPPIDTRKYGALGVWIYGDGKGQVLNFQLRDMPQYYHGTYDDHYIDVDFVGWRYFELLLRERDAERHGDFIWPYFGIYQIYRSPLVKHAVNELNIYVNNVPQNESITCYISPIKALPLRRLKFSNPAISVNGKRIEFPVTLESGQYIEFESPSNCKHYRENGELIAYITTTGTTPILNRGQNMAVFSCKPEGTEKARAKLTFICTGRPIKGISPKRKINWEILRVEYDDPRIIYALDGRQNEWDLICRRDAKSAILIFELTVNKVEGKIKELRSFSISINGKRVIFPVSLRAGDKLLYKSPHECVILTKDGEKLVKPKGGVIRLRPGRNRLRVLFDTDGVEGFQVRVIMAKVY